MKRKILFIVLFVVVGFYLTSCTNDDPKSVIITFDAGENVLVISPVEVKFKGKLENLPQPEKTGYKFIGWFIDDEEFKLSRAVTENITLTAKWEEKELLTVNYLYNYDNLTKTETFYNEDKLTKEEDPIRVGYKFMGWFLDDVLFDFENEVTKSITLIAKWEKQEIINYSFKDGPNQTYTLEDFRIEDIIILANYADGYIQEIKANKEMLDYYDFESLFGVGSYYLYFKVEDTNLRLYLTFTTNIPETIPARVIIYAIKETIDNKDVYTFYSMRTGSFVSMELELLFSDSASLEADSFALGLFSHMIDENTLKIIYSFGEELTGDNKLFSLTGDAGFKLDFVFENSSVYTFINEEVTKEETARFYIR